MSNIIIEPSYEQNRRDAYHDGDGCNPPDELGMIAAISWADGWLQARGEDPSNDHKYLPDSPLKDQ